MAVPVNFKSFFLFSLFLLLGFSLSSQTSQQEKEKPLSFIIRAKHDAKPSIFPTHKHWYQSTLQSLFSSDSSPENQVSGNPSLASSFSGTLIHTYSTVFHGFSAKITPSMAKKLEKMAGILSVIPDKARQLQTTRSPQFLGLKRKDTMGLLAESDFGSNLIIGVLDTGIWPERRSFSDRGLGPVPSSWKGECVEGRGFSASSCNRKLVGARYFSGGYEAMSGPMNETAEYRSPRDSDGHGTHTASIAAGRYVYPADMLGYAHGVAAGMAPKARLAAYKVCWTSGCFDSDILAAFDRAVLDGVNVISLSVGGGVVPFYLDSIAIGAFAAAQHNIFVSASAGNEGPAESTVTNVAPWITTVGAGTLDRNFPAEISLGNGVKFSGVSLYSGPHLSQKPEIPLVYAGNAPATGGDGYSSSLCMENSLDPEMVRGKIVLCDRGSNARVNKGIVVKEAGGVGMILANGAGDGEGLVADSHVLPAAAIGANAGDLVRSYVNSVKNPTATIRFQGTQLGVRPAPVVASFSARGPNPVAPEILKPDVIAPGVNILAAWTDDVGPAGVTSDRRKTEFNILSGTSMACPHVSGLAALLMGAHPDWTPSMIRSALMTTAYVRDNRGGPHMLDEATWNASSPLDYGAGHVDPNRAMVPGLVYDLTIQDHVDFLCSSNYSAKNIEIITRKPEKCGQKVTHAGNLNYPAISAVFERVPGRAKMSTHFIRTVTNVGDGPSVYKVTVKAPLGSVVSVEPGKLVFTKVKQRLSFVVRVEVRAVKLVAGGSRVSTGYVTWTDGKHVVNSPIVVTLQEPY
ncbi:hypothetical protein AMTRI_Chr13g117130 [Amborella trichopoda]